MSDLKIVIYKENHAPRNLELNSRSVIKTLFLLSFLGMLLIVSIALSMKLYFFQPKVTIAQSTTNSSESDSVNSNSPEEQVKTLKDQVDVLENKLKNQANLANVSKEIDKKNPALALFSPNVTDRTKNQDVILIKNINYIPGSSNHQTTLTFELHNPKPDEGTSRGYIVVLARSDKNLFSYPNIFNPSSPYLLDFEKGETFAISRFRAVNAQFELPNTPESFQVLIFSRSGELLINESHEIKKQGGGQ